jgi:hypothetical protein
VTLRGLMQVRFGREQQTFTYRYRLREEYRGLEEGCQIVVPTSHGPDIATLVCLGSTYSGPLKEILAVVGIDYDVD